MTPLLWIGTIDLGVVPTLRQSWKIADAVGLCAFAADGWMCAGLAFAWPIILFSTLGSSYDTLGYASSAAGVAGALTGLACGTVIDRGHRGKLSHAVMAGLLAGIALRVASGWAPWTAFAANVVGAAVSGAYYPVLMSIVYDRAKRSGSAYVFHLSAEAGWDAGAILGCLAAAAVAWSGAPATLAVLPSALRHPADPSLRAGRIQGRRRLGGHHHYPGHRDGRNIGGKSRPAPGCLNATTFNPTKLEHVRPDRKSSNSYFAIICSEQFSSA